MKKFKQFLESKIFLEQEPAPDLAAGAPPAAGGDMGMAPPDLGGAMGAPPGMGAPPLGGGLGGPSLSPGLDPMAGGGGAPGGSPVAKKLKAYNIWDVLKKILDSEPEDKLQKKK